MKTNWERNKPIIEPNFESFSEIIHSYYPDGRINEIELLTGGLSHSNYKIELIDSTWLVARFTTNKKTLILEQNLHRILPEQVKAPRFLYLSHKPEYSVALVEWKRGVLLRDRLSSSANEMYAIGHSVGEQLASLRQLTFPSQGFLDKHVKVEQPFRLTPESFYSIIESFIEKGPMTSRISKSLTNRILVFAKEHASLFLEDESEARLVHGDFNGLNILIEGTEVSAVLDWEFAFAGSIYLDIGNMIRYDHFPNMESFEDGLLSGLRNNGIVLSPNWRKLAKLADLVALCSLLDSKYGGENRFKDITRLIEKTLRSYS
ncbi:phosphotransferase family protein [Guptibacillus algicola]|uniref:phosphotransferase family protein n=1 Tax=Guptibacillus algicola TaxID=225844 RepID=UPI001CD3AF85|nr:phosphotransferase [Alkalihalobacillus algicola]MCA0988336.1 phosphotransferase [Alkalihalobacillus algicola]